MGNFISMSAVKDYLNDLKWWTFTFIVVVKLNFLWKIHRHFSIKTISKLGLKTFLGTFDSYNDFTNDDKFDVASSKNNFMSSVEQCVASSLSFR